MPECAGLRLLITKLMLVYYLLNLVLRGQTANYFCGCGINRVWHISDTKVVPTLNKFWLGVN